MQELMQLQMGGDLAGGGGAPPGAISMRGGRRGRRGGRA